MKVVADKLEVADKPDLLTNPTPAWKDSPRSSYHMLILEAMRVDVEQPAHKEKCNRRTRECAHLLCSFQLPYFLCIQQACYPAYTY